MIVERSLDEQFLSNTFLIADREGGSAAFVDAGGPVAPLLAKADELGVTVTHVLLTHHHWDHVQQLDQILERWPDAAVVAGTVERDLYMEDFATKVTSWVDDGHVETVGDLEVRHLLVPGHTAGMFTYVVDGHAFTADTLFKRSVGGVRAPGSTSYADIKHSIMEVLMKLPHETVIHPGHVDDSTIGDEWEHNAFVRVWRGLDPEGSEPCTALDQPATLILRAPDYDGGTKCWVRWEDGSDDIVPGSKVEVG